MWENLLAYISLKPKNSDYSGLCANFCKGAGCLPRWAVLSISTSLCQTGRKGNLMHTRWLSGNIQCLRTVRSCDEDEKGCQTCPLLVRKDRREIHAPWTPVLEGFRRLHFATRSDWQSGTESILDQLQLEGTVAGITSAPVVIGRNCSRHPWELLFQAQKPKEWMSWYW